MAETCCTPHDPTCFACGTEGDLQRAIEQVDVPVPEARVLSCRTCDGAGYVEIRPGSPAPCMTCRPPVWRVLEVKR